MRAGLFLWGVACASRVGAVADDEVIDRELADVKLFEAAELQPEFADGELADGESADGDGSEGDGTNSQRTAGCCADFDEGTCAWAKSHAGIVDPLCGPVIRRIGLRG